MRFAIAFLFGAVIGAAVALIYAPSSGEEMRANIKTQMDAQSAKLQEQWQQGYQQVQSQIDKLSSEVQSFAKQEKEAEPAVE